MVNLQAHTQQPRHEAIRKTSRWIIHANGRKFNTVPFLYCYCRHYCCCRRENKQSVKQFSTQLQLSAKLRSYAFIQILILLSFDALCLSYTIPSTFQHRKFPDAPLITENKSFVLIFFSLFVCFLRVPPTLILFLFCK